MVAIKNIIFLISAATAAVIRRDAATVMKDLGTITTAVTGFTTTVQGFTGTLIGALPVQSAEGTIDTALKTATMDAAASAPLSAADSAMILSMVKTKLNPAVMTTLTTLTGKKAAFATAGVTSTVVTDLTALKASTDAYGKALLAIADPSIKTAAQAQITQIDGYFTTASAAFA